MDCRLSPISPMRASANIFFCLARAESKRTAHHLNKGQEWRLLTVRRTTPRKDKTALLINALTEFVQKA